MARMTLEQIKASRPEADRAKIDATSEEDIACQMREDGERSGVGHAWLARSRMVSPASTLLQPVCATLREPSGQRSAT